MAAEIMPEIEPASEMAVSNARSHLKDLLSAAHEAPVTLTSHGRPTAVVVNAATYQQLIEAWEDAMDQLAYDQAKAEDDGEHIPWEEIKADLGL